MKKSTVKRGEYIKVEGMSHEQIGAILGVSKQRIQQIEKSALKKLAKSGKAKILKQFLMS